MSDQQHEQQPDGERGGRGWPWDGGEFDRTAALDEQELGIRYAVVTGLVALADYLAAAAGGSGG